MKFLITGATGLIGKNLVNKLTKQTDSKLSQPHEITVLTRQAKPVKAYFGEKVKIITELSIADIENTDTVINLAGEPIADKRWSKIQKDKICQSRWQLTEQLVSLINQAQQPPLTFISGSAIGFYGRQDNKPINESYQDTHDEFSHQICKRWEEIALGAQSDQTRVVILRTGIVLAKNGGALKKMLLPFKLGLGGHMASGEQMMSWIHIDDMVAAIAHLVEHKALEGAINLTAPNAVSNTDFSNTLATQLARPCFLFTPTWLLKLLFGEMADLLIYGQNVKPAKLLADGFTFKYEHLPEALNQIIQGSALKKSQP